MEGNLTRGPILKTLTKLAIPIMASSFLGTLYNITDMAWIGLLGAKAVAGVGVGGMFTWLSQGLASMARMGGQVQVAQCIGRGEKQKAHGFAQTAMQLALLMGLAYGIFVALTPNLSGLAEPFPGISVGDHVSVFLRAILEEKHKIKMNILERLPAPVPPQPLEYYITSGHINRWDYFPGSRASTVF